MDALPNDDTVDKQNRNDQLVEEALREHYFQLRNKYFATAETYSGMHTRAITREEFDRQWEILEGPALTAACKCWSQGWVKTFGLEPLS